MTIQSEPGQGTALERWLPLGTVPVGVEAASGEDALRPLQEGAGIDLLVTDHLMPELTGVVEPADRDGFHGRPSGYARARARRDR